MGRMLKNKKKRQKIKEKEYHEYQLYKGEEMEKGSCFDHDCEFCRYLKVFMADHPCNCCAKLCNSGKCYFKEG